MRKLRGPAEQPRAAKRIFHRQALEEAAPALRGDREVVLSAVKSSKGWALQHLA